MLEWMMPLVELCRSAISTGKIFVKWHESSLSEREKELLIAACQDGVLYVGKNEDDGVFVGTTDTNPILK